MSSAGNMSLYCPSCKRYVTIVLCESSCSAPHCSLCNWCLCESHSHNPIPKTTTKETETNKAEGTSKSPKEKNLTSKNNVKENDNQTSESQVNTTGKVVRSQENPTPQVYHISLESVIESFRLLCIHGDDDASTSTTGRGSEDDYAFTVVWEYDPNLGQRESHNSKSKK